MTGPIIEKATYVCDQMEITDKYTFLREVKKIPFKV